MASRQAWRKAWWQIHKWVGLFLMVLLIPLGLSGIVLAWDDAIDHVIHPQRYAVSGAPVLGPSAYTQVAATRLKPDERIVGIRYPDEGNGPVIVTITQVRDDNAKKAHGDKGRGGKGAGMPQRSTLWLDPADGHVLDMQRGRGNDIISLSHAFHGSLFVPGFGRALIGLLGVAMALMAIGGVWLWWPPIGSWIKGLRWQRGDRRLDTNLHHRYGFWIALPLALQACTGVWIAWPQMMAVVRGAPAPGAGMIRAKMVPAAQTHLSPDAALGAARAAASGAPASINWPLKDDATWRVVMATAHGPASLKVDDDSAAVTPAPARAATLADTMRHIHDGSLIGWGWRVLMVAWGLAPTVLGVTGLLMWLRGRRWRARAVQRGRSRKEPVAAA